MIPLHLLTTADGKATAIRTDGFGVENLFCKAGKEEQPRDYILARV